MPELCALGSAVETVTIRGGPVPNSRRWRLLLGGAAVVLAIAYLILSSTHGATVYALTIHELKSRGQAAYDQGVRVGGTVDGQSIRWDDERMLLNFSLVDGADSLPVHYQGSQPDMFRDGAEALVEGRLLSTGVFEAKKLLLKCPSKYEAAATLTATK